MPSTHGGAGINVAAGTPGSAVVNINAENEISFSISDAQGRSQMSGIVARWSPSGGTASQLRTWFCNVSDTVGRVTPTGYDIITFRRGGGEYDKRGQVSLISRRSLLGFRDGTHETHLSAR